MRQGPTLQYLMQRLSQIPPEFLLTPDMKKQPKAKGQIDVSAVVSDLLFDCGGGFLPKEGREVFALLSGQKNRNYLHVVLILCYLLHDSWFTEKQEFAGFIIALFKNPLLFRLAQLVPPVKFIKDSERREELIRIALKNLHLIPEGETKVQAQDRLVTLDSIERVRIIEQTRKAREKARKLQEALARKQAEEAASKWSRE